MDKSTLSNYGWIVIAVLVLAVMIALATPFGNYVKAGVESTTAGLFDTSEKAMNVVGMSAGNGSFESGSGETGTQTPTEPETPKKDPALNPSGTIPEGGTYYVGVISTVTTNYAGATTTLSAGDEFPATVKTGDVYVYGDYEYRYNQFSNGSTWVKAADQNGWGVRVLNKGKSSYGAILESINGYEITNMYGTFYYCERLTTAPVIPESVINMHSTFMICRALTVAPVIPNNVTVMFGTFQECIALEIAPVIPSSVDNIGKTFYGCTNLNGTVVVDGTPGMYTQFLYNSNITSVKISDGTTHPMESALLATK